MAKTLKINMDALKASDRAVVQGMLGFLGSQPVEVQYKTLRPLILASYGEATKNIIALEGGVEAGGMGAKILAFLGIQENQDRLRPVMAQIKAVDAEIESVATLNVSLFDEALGGKWLTDEEGHITARRLDIPVEMLGATPDLIAKSEALLKERWTQFVNLLRAAKVVSEDKEPRGGKLAFENGKLTWKVPVKKPSTPRDPNAPKAERAAKGATYDLVFGEGEGAEVVATGLTGKVKIVNAAAKFVHANKDKFPNGGLTHRDESIGSVNFPRAYAPKLQKLGFRWTENTTEAK